MAIRFFDLVGGIKKVRLQGKRQERVINMASARGIYIWGIRKVGDRIEFRVRDSGFEALKHIAEENGYELEVVEEKGFYLWRGIIRRRLGFIVGALVFILALYFLSSFVWTLEVSGNQKVDKNKILIIAAKYGLYEGAPKWSFKRSEVEEGLLKDLSQLSYVKVDIRGVKANIEVVEKILPDENANTPCHLVASRDGIVCDMLVLQGEPSVKIGDVVAKGDILISGIVFPHYDLQEEEDEDIPLEELKPYTVRARGEVKARVWYEGYGECPLKKEEVLLTGKSYQRFYFKAGEKIFWLKGDKKPDFVMATRKKRGKFIKTPWGDWGWGEEVWLEEMKKTTVYSEEEALKIARQKALKALKAELPRQAKRLETKTEVISTPGDAIIRVKAQAEVIENIAVCQPIEKKINLANW
ncbi:similar to stage IV sporulation protein [Thermosyntropha lipolytica DSM 11003]|uniref:Similar to stage IV sporulation protein n=1 Tax=Thermosyntropha lipolytica DSM 11003 TaxID=1123382 RepID=A0A1M5N8Q2_9FIRM|nr:sporulation protein YqfD [Thermosyntropha lipolytica]SHG85924.1 similar to stage IV sporulation protein [Thermosyntropha lipolytica DSM 11003]